MIQAFFIEIRYCFIFSLELSELCLSGTIIETVSQF
jgi:hypothetical protein